MDCERTQKMISLYLAGDLAGEELEALMAHLASCEKCRAAFEEAKHYEAVLKGVLKESVSKSRSPKSRVLRSIKEGKGRRPGKSLANWFVFILLMAALCLIIIIAYVSYEKVKQDNIRKALSAKAQLKVLTEVLKQYRADCGAYPVGANAGMVQALQTKRKGKEMPYFKFRAENLSKGELVDPWRRPYVYRSTGEAALLYSTGPNLRDEEGLGDDIRP